MNKSLLSFLAQKYFKRNFKTQSNLYNQSKKKIKPENKHPHIPVMLEETMRYINLSPGDTMIDMTFGAGGHSSFILENIPNVKIFALDRDPLAYKYAQKLAEKYPNQVIPLLGRFSELTQLLLPHGVFPNSIDCILCDFGVSSMQFDTPERGFSISKNGPLDMRMDGNSSTNYLTAADVIDKVNETDLYRIIKYYGEDHRARQIAKAIVDFRYNFRSPKTTKELADLIDSIFPSVYNSDKLGRFQHSATKTFQALRIFVNNELNEINYAMTIAQNLLKIHGRLITISFHSLEDTIVKRHLSGNVTDTVANKLPLKYYSHGISWSNIEEIHKLTESPWKMLHQHIIVPSDPEIESNPRSRSAKFRALVKVK